MKNYQVFYERLTASLRESPQAVLWVNLLNNSITRIIYLLYPILLVGVFWQTWAREELLQALFATLPYVLIPAVSFVVLSLVRKALNYPRPYEAWPIETIIQKDTNGNSMPSRHVFSATIIAMCVLHVHTYLGLILLLAALVLAVLRVLGGVHYPKDVILGFVVGVLAGCLLWLF